MAQYDNRVIQVVAGTLVLALGLSLVSFLYFPFQLEHRWLLALISMLGLALVSALFALQMTRTGSTTSLDFVPQLGALLLIGPTGALSLTFVSEFLTQLVVKKRGHVKSTYNTAQLVISVFVASIVYVLLGGTWSLTTINFANSLLPFMAAATTYFLLNRAAVSYIVSLTEESEISDVWDRISSKLLLVDVAISPLAILVAYLYIRWGPLSLFLSVLPIIALRYTYGVNIELQQLNRDLLRALIRTLEAQDPYTSGHSIRVAEGAKRIAAELDLSKNEIHKIEQAALLHDIGKVGGEYHEILQQEGGLTDRQTEVIREHPQRGARIIEPVRSLPAEIRDCIEHHHERYDGSGYPAGLSGDKIPLGARIIMVADTIDAMRTTRPYRTAKPLDDIKEELISLKGIQFDPEVVDAALEAGLLKEETAIDVNVDADQHSP